MHAACVTACLVKHGAVDVYIGEQFNSRGSGVGKLACILWLHFYFSGLSGQQCKSWAGM